MAHSQFSLGKYWQLEPADIDHKMLYFALRIETMDQGGPGGLLGAHYRPGGTPKQPLLKSLSPQMSKKVGKCEFCFFDYVL